MRWLNLFYCRNRPSIIIAPWLLERSVLSFSFSQKASIYKWTREAGYDVFSKSKMLGHNLLLDGKLDETMVVSPLSFQLVLSLLAAGSSGSTRRQFLNFFNADSVDHLNSCASVLSSVLLTDRVPAFGPRVRCSTALWYDQSLTLEPSFKRILDSHHRAALNPVDFQTKTAPLRQQINSWVENKASGLVKDLIREGSLNNLVKLVFTNALYFRGAWDPESDISFLLKKELREDEYLVETPFMTVRGTEIFGRDLERHRISWQCHPYKRQSEDKRKFYSNFYFTEDGVKDLMDIDGELTPLFNISSEVEASNVLRGLGMTSPFSGGELTKMLIDGGDLYVFNIFHKSFIQVDEDGTEAATATVAILMSGCPPYLPNIPVISHVYLPYPFSVGSDECESINFSRTELMVHQVVNGLPR